MGDELVYRDDLFTKFESALLDGMRFWRYVELSPEYDNMNTQIRSPLIDPFSYTIYKFGDVIDPLETFNKGKDIYNLSVDLGITYNINGLYQSIYNTAPYYNTGQTSTESFRFRKEETFYGHTLYSMDKSRSFQLIDNQETTVINPYPAGTTGSRPQY